MGTIGNAKVSVAIPAYNAERTILDCLESILNQTWTNLEIVVCDDASTDNTCSLINSIKDDRLRLLRNDENRGEGATRDAAIAACRGQWIALCDADDAWLPGRLGALWEAAAGNERAVVFDNILMCHDLKGKLVPWKCLRRAGDFGACGNPVRVGIACWLDSKSVLMQPFLPRDLLLASQASHSARSFGDDIHFILKLLAAGGVLVFVPNAYYYYRVSSVSASSNKKRYTLFREVFESCLEDFRDRPEVYAALQRKIGRIRRLECYREFLNAVKKGDIRKALLLLMRTPWFLWEFARHNGNMTLSRLHRLKYSALPWLSR